MLKRLRTAGEKIAINPTRQSSNIIAAIAYKPAPASLLLSAPEAKDNDAINYYQKQYLHGCLHGPTDF